MEIHYKGQVWKTKRGTNAYCKHMNVKIKLTFACARVWLKHTAIKERGQLYMWEWRDYEWWLFIRLVRVSIRTGSNLGLTFPKLIERGWNGEHVCICVPIYSCVERIMGWDCGLTSVFYAIFLALPGQVQAWTSDPKIGC